MVPTVSFRPSLVSWKGEYGRGSYRLQVGEGGVEGVRNGIGLLREDLVDDLETEPLEREAYAEDDVVRTAYPQRPAGSSSPTARAQPPHVEVMFLLQPHRANRVTTPCFALQGATRE